MTAPLGRQIAELRAARGLSQAETAQRSGLRQATLSRIETGTSKPTLDTLERLAQTLGAHLVLAPEADTTQHTPAHSK
jgi:transcriptional regulator with XRE-family HTH domain